MNTVAKKLRALLCSSAAALCAVLLLSSPLAGADAQARSITFNLDIPAQDLGTALQSLALASQHKLLYRSDLVQGRTSPALKGNYTTESALQELLAGTDLTFEVTSSSVVFVRKKAEDKPGDAQKDGVPTPTAAAPDKAEPIKPGAFDRFRLAQADLGPNAPSSAVASDASASRDSSASNKLEEIVVTAQKRVERLQDVPIPVTAISAQTLLDTNQLRLQDYYTSVPGLNVTPAASGSSQQLTIRGITTGVVATNPTVGVTVDDVPFTASTQIAGGGSVPVPDIDPGDLQRVEVLRGPQGTLYGASSLGGLLKFVTVDPSTDGISARIQAGASSVYNGADLGYNIRGSVNLPLGDTFAVRASGFFRRDPGYIDNVQAGQYGVNSAEVAGARLSALWKPSERLSFKFSALYQDMRGEGFADVDKPINEYVGPPLADLQQSYIRGTGSYDRKVQAYSVVTKATLGSAELTSITGYNVNQFADTYDLTYVYGPYTQTQFGVPGTAAPESGRTSKFTEELRLADSVAGKLDWLLGGFYTHEGSQYFQDILAAEPTSGAIEGQFAHYSAPATYEEYAAFADLTLHFTSQFDIQVGGRESRIEETFAAMQTGPLNDVFGLPSPYLIPEEQSRNTAFTYLVTPRLRLSPDLMIYARLASGYRPGGPNADVPGLPAKYDPDRTRNYEIGAKADFWDRTLSVDTSVYYIDWQDIQIFLLNPLTGQGYTANGSRAKSQGLELSAELRPLTGLKITGWVAWGDAELTAALPADTTAAAGPGDRLPYSSRFSANASLEQSFPLAYQLTGFAAIAASYVGNRQGEFASLSASTPDRQQLPAYTKLDLRAGVHHDVWTVDLYVNNLTDQRGLLSGGLGTSPPFAFMVLQPRTVGLTVSEKF